MCKVKSGKTFGFQQPTAWAQHPERGNSRLISHATNAAGSPPGDAIRPEYGYVSGGDVSGSKWLHGRWLSNAWRALGVGLAVVVATSVPVWGAEPLSDSSPPVDRASAVPADGPAGAEYPVDENPVKQSPHDAVTEGLPSERGRSDRDAAGGVAPRAMRSARRLPRFFGKLDLLEEQREKIFEIQQHYQQELERMEVTLAELRLEREAEVRKVLTEDQLARLTQLTQESRPRPRPVTDPSAVPLSSAEPETRVSVSEEAR